MNHNPQAMPPTASKAAAASIPGVLLCCVKSIWLRLNSQLARLYIVATASPNNTQYHTSQLIRCRFVHR